MTEYYLSDRRARETERVRDGVQAAEPLESQNVKVTLLGDFLFPSAEPQGFDPYNSMQGKTPRDAWKASRARR